MKVFKYFPPYKTDGKTRFPETANRSGVYLIKENDRLVYVGYSGINLYKTLYRHFQRWNHKTQEVTTYYGSRKTYTVRVIFCTPAQAAKLERALIIKHQPRDNEQKYQTYKLTKTDLNIVSTYESAGVELVCPF